ncbi:MAG: hypothetical protein ACYCQJ_02715 [Nitrososphaerales archaeon]
MRLSERKKREIRALADSSSEALVALAEHNKDQGARKKFDRSLNEN